MTKIQGITVTLYEREQSGTDSFGTPTYTETAVDVENVLAAPVSETETTSSSPAELGGRRSVYQIAVPKGDTHEWINNRVSFFGQSWRVIGGRKMGIAANLPLMWNAIYQVECIDGE